MKVSGTPEEVTVDGTPLDVFSDTNITLNTTGIKVDGDATSGETMYSHTRVLAKGENLTVAVDLTTDVILSELNNRLSTYPISIKLAGGDVYSTTGKISYSGFDTDKGKATITVIPSTSRNPWTPVAAA